MAEMSPLRRRMIEDMTIRNLSPATQQSYLYAVSKFSRHFGHSPDRLGVEDVRAYLVHLTSKGFAWSSLNQTVCALRFFYGVTQGQLTIVDRIPFAREPRKLPTVLSADEVVRFLEAVSSLKARVALTTAYAAGLRVSEVAALKISDIDSRRMVVRIERGKGGKERYAMLSEMMRMSTPLSRRCVAKLCRRTCTLTVLSSPAAAVADRQAACSTLGSTGVSAGRPGNRNGLGRASRQ